jgi:DHA2 family multidrug resistance protein
MIRNLGGAIGIAVIQTFLTKRDQFHSDILTAQVSLLDDATRTRLNGLTRMFLQQGISDTAYARQEAMVVVGRAIHRQAMMIAYSDTIILQSMLLGLALFAVLWLKKPKAGSAGEAH